MLINETRAIEALKLAGLSPSLLNALSHVLVDGVRMYDQRAILAAIK